MHLLSGALFECSAALLHAGVHDGGGLLRMVVDTVRAGLGATLDVREYDLTNGMADRGVPRGWRPAVLGARDVGLRRKLDHLLFGGRLSRPGV